ncbi:MAG: hypothetical protein KKE05_04825 [Nanoarchaeota archaeon]|nr:hypothetical protein [Nanoarchaeota archaeon]
MTGQQKQWIDSASYEQLLRRWRESPIGSDWFNGDTGEYYSKIMAEKREQVGDDEHVRASKSIGWD